MGKKSKKKTVAEGRKPVEKDTEINEKQEQGEKIKKPKKHKVFLEKGKQKIASLKSLPKSLKISPSKITAAESQKIKGILVMLVGVAALVFVGVFLLYKFFRPQPLAQLLPADSTVALAEVNIDVTSGQSKKFFELLKNYPAYQKEQLIGLLNVALPLNYETEIAPWIGRLAGLAFIVNHQNGEMNPVLFLESKDAQKTMQFFTNRSLKDNNEITVESYNGINIYSYKQSQNYSFCFINSYVVVAGNKNLLQEVINAQNEPKLQSDENYMKVANNLPQGSLAFAYLNAPKLFDALLKNAAFASRKGREFANLQPFLKIFSGMGVTVFADNNAFDIQTFSGIDQKELSGNSYLTYSEKYQGNLLKLADENISMMVGGHDLKKELGRLEDIFKTGTKTSSIVFEGLLEAQKQKYLGKDISLNEDIYPLLKGEYLFTMGKTSTNPAEKPDISFLLELKDKENDLIRIEKIVNAFVKISAIFQPEIQEVTLPDGTKGQEVVASPEQVSRTDQAYQGTNISSLQLGAGGLQLNYATLGNTLIFSTSLESMHRMIDRSVGTLTTNLKQSELFRKKIEPLFRNADEITHMDLRELVLPSFGVDPKNDPILGQYLAPFTTMTTARNFFDDGISDLYTVDIGK